MHKGPGIPAQLLPSRWPCNLVIKVPMVGRLSRGAPFWALPVRHGTVCMSRSVVVNVQAERGFATGHTAAASDATSCRVLQIGRL